MHADGDAFGFEGLGGQDGLGHQQAVGDDGDIGAFHHLDGLADFELLIGAVDDGRLRAAGADEDRSDVRRGGA